MSDTTDGAARDDMNLDPGPEAATGSPLTPAEELSTRERTQRHLIRAGAAARAATTRARQSATLPSRRTAGPVDESQDAASVTLAERAQAYRAHAVSVAAAVVVLLVVIMKRRASAHRAGDTLDLGEWHLEAEPVDE